MNRFIAHLVSSGYLALGYGFAIQTYADIITERYPWADHIPVCCVLVGSIAALVNYLGFALVARSRN